MSEKTTLVRCSENTAGGVAPWCTRFLLLLCGVFLLGFRFGWAAAPEFAVTTTADGVFHIYSTYTQTSATQYSVTDARLSAVVTDLGNNQWQLSIQANQDLENVYFPWQTQRAPLDSDITDDFYYYPYILGISEQALNRNVDYSWWGLEYPALAFAPLVVMADDYHAMIVAATNWPPKAVTPKYAAQRLVLDYGDSIPAGTSSTYQALIAVIAGDASTGTVPWQLAVDLYRAWLDTQMPPITYPSWMWDGQGFLNIQLENMPTVSTTMVENLWQPQAALYPWVLFWGQMSPYAGSCCALQQTNDYQPAVTNAVSSIAASGNHAGYYSSPYRGTSSSDPPQLLDTSAGVAWLTNWLAANRGYGANSYYIDTLGRSYWGQPAAVLQLFNDGVIPPETMIEGAVDIYPPPGLVSGALVGDITLCGAPQKNPESAPTTTFPRFGRYILQDRLIYSGLSNTDYRFWGTGQWNTPGDSIDSTCSYSTWCTTNGPCAYGTERLNFLLGAKLDMYPNNGNPVVDAVISERQRVGWWNRYPVYLDTQGLNLSNIPAGSAVEIRRFRDLNGATLLAVSNPNLLSGLTFTVDGKTLSVPAQAIAVIDLASNPSPSCDVNGDGVVNVLDVQAAVDQLLGITPCTTADLQENGQCTIVDVQRVINAMLGGPCVLGP